MTYALTFDNSWAVMSEDEMHDVNGGGSIRISVSRALIMGASAAMASGGAGALFALVAPQILAHIVLWLAFSTSLGPVGVVITAVLAVGVLGGLVSFIAASAAAFLAGAAYDTVMTIASGFFVPNFTLRLR